MTYSLRFIPELEEDLAAGFEWYEDKASGLGAEFLAIFYSHVEVLQRTPFIFSKVHLDFHRGLLRQFPFACYYLVVDDSVVVYGLFHCARNPLFVTDVIAARHGS